MPAIDWPKSGKPRAVVIPPHIRADVKHHLDVFTAKDAEALVFSPQRGGCHMNDRVFRDAIAKPLKDIKRSDLRIHDLRHFSGTMTARVGTWPNRCRAWSLDREGIADLSECGVGP